MEKFSGFRNRNMLIDNYTPVENVFIEKISAEIETLSELKVILVIYRHTYGYVEGVDLLGNKIYREHFFTTIRRLAELTGLTITSVNVAINKLLELGYIEKLVFPKKKIAYKIKQKPTP